MHEIYQLKEMLCKELEEYGRKGEMSAGTLEIVDKLAHAVKNLGKIIEMYEDEEEYSERGGQGGGGGNRYAREGGGGNRYSREYRYSREGGSYARGRGRNANRDSRGRYASEGGYSRAEDEMVEQLQMLMGDAPNEQIRKEIQRLITKMEQM